MLETAGLPTECDEYGVTFVVQPGDVYNFF